MHDYKMIRANGMLDTSYVLSCRVHPGVVSPTAVEVPDAVSVISSVDIMAKRSCYVPGNFLKVKYDKPGETVRNFA